MYLQLSLLSAPQNVQIKIINPLLYKNKLDMDTIHNTVSFIDISTVILIVRLGRHFGDNC